MSENVQNALVRIEPIFVGTDGLTRRKRQVDRLLLTPRETAATLGICERTLYTLTKQGEIPVVRAGRLVRYSVEDLKTWIKKSSENS
ncbi:MAG TPA: helix-turn-helix domain-containing protein [Sedimentisphaerales bacterium]|nr:helix-turn-helix domain-containing protein [Sedimentisphaerales bacterium]